MFFDVLWMKRFVRLKDLRTVQDKKNGDELKAKIKKYLGMDLINKFVSLLSDFADYL